MSMTTDKKVAFYTLGCKLNFSETSTIARDFQTEGFERVEFDEFADIYVIIHVQSQIMPTSVQNHRQISS